MDFSLSGISQALGGMFGGSALAPAPQAPTLPQVMEESALVDFVEKRYQFARRSKEVMLQTWATCLAFYGGEQWRTWEDKTKRLVQPTRIPSYRVLSVYNQLPGIMDVAAAKLTRSRQLPRARPDEPNDPEDQERAKKSTHALRAWWYGEGMDEHEHEANIHRLLFGGAYLHLYWDPRKLAKIAVPELAVDPLTGLPVQRTRAEYAPVGQLCAEVLSVFDVFPEPCEKWRDISWVVIARRKPLHWFKDMFPERGGQVTADGAEAEDVLNSLIPGLEAEGTAPPDGDGMATLLTYYEVPCEQYPEGRTVMLAGKTLLFQQGGLPLPHQGCRTALPVKEFIYRRMPKRIWAKGLIEECLGPQRELNRGISNLSELLRLYRAPKRWIDKAWRVSPKAITTAPNEVVEGNFGGQNPVGFVESPPNLPAWVGQYSEIQREELRHVAGQHEVSEGMVPSGVQAASAIALLQDAENLRSSSPANLGRIGLEEFSKHVLTVLTERYREGRLMSVPQRAGGEEAAVITGEELGPLEVVVEMSSGAEDSDAVRQEIRDKWLPVAMQTLGTPQFAAALATMPETGEGWLADIWKEHQEAMMVQLQQQQLAEQAMLAEEQGMAQAGQEAELAAQQEEQALQAEQAERQRGHERELKGLDIAAQLAQQEAQGDNALAVARERVRQVTPGKGGKKK